MATKDSKTNAGKTEGTTGKPTAAAPGKKSKPTAAPTQTVATVPTETEKSAAPVIDANDPFAELRALQSQSASRFGDSGVADTSKKGKSKKTELPVASVAEVKKVLPFIFDSENLGTVKHVVDNDTCQGYAIGQDMDGNYVVSHFARITPKVALFLLRNHNPHGKDGNRPMSLPLSKGYAEDMKDGSWGFSANALTMVGHESTIGDAQHQLQAIVDSGCTQLFIVTYGIRPEFADYINGGKPRSPKDAIARHGHFDRYRELWTKEGKSDKDVTTLVGALEKIFSETIRTIGLRRLGLTVRGTHALLKKKHYFRNLENLFTSSTTCCIDVHTINKATRKSEPNKKGEMRPTGKGALESLAQLAYFAAAQYLASAHIETVTGDDETAVDRAVLNMETVKTIHAFWEDVADSRNDATKFDGENASQVNACRLRRFLEICNTSKSGIAGAGNNIYMAKFTAIMMAVQKTLEGEELTPADLSKIKVNPGSVVYLSIPETNPEHPAGLDDYALRAAALSDESLEEESGEGEEEEEEEEESTDDDSEESTDDESEESDDDDSEEE